MSTGGKHASSSRCEMSRVDGERDMRVEGDRDMHTALGVSSRSVELRSTPNRNACMTYDL